MQRFRPVLSVGLFIPALWGGGCGDTPLHSAAEKADLARVESLLARGCAVNARGRRGLTPLHCACAGYAEPSELGRKVAVVELLLKHGADPNARNEFGQAPLHLTDHKEIAAALLAAGADVNAKEESGLNPLHLVAGLHFGLDVVFHDDGSCSFTERTIRLRRELLEFLLENGADVGARSGVGQWTALHMAARFIGTELNAQAKALADTEILLRHGADVNARDGSGVTPLTSAKEAGNWDVVELLKRHGGRE